LKESASSVNRDGGAGTCALDGAGDIRLLISPALIRDVYFQGVLAPALIDLVTQGAEFSDGIRFALPEPSGASVLALQNFYYLLSCP
jgi:hypothetical protein